jgi:hypothetical protein
MAVQGFPPIGNPQDMLRTGYDYGGQMAPETAIAEQALNRRRLIANMLMQKGMQQGPGGKMVGRFYVADSPLQGGANLAASLAGVLGARNIDKQQDEVMGKDRQMVLDALQAHQAKMNPQYQSPAESTGMPPSAQQAPPPPVVPPSPEPAGQALPPRPDGPYTGQVGAAAMPEAGVQSTQPPVQTQPFSSIAGQENMQGLNMEQAAPADMGQMVTPPQATPAQPLPSPAPAPTSPTTPPVRFVEPPAPPKPTMQDLAGLLTHQHPQVRQYGQFLAQQMQREQERQATIDQMTHKMKFDERLEGLKHTNAKDLKGVLSADVSEKLALEKDQFKNISAADKAKLDSAEKLHGIPSGNIMAQTADQVTVLDPKTGRIVPNQPAIDAKQKIAAAGAAKTSVNVDQGVPFATTLQGELAKGVAQSKDAAMAAQQSLGTIKQVEDAIATGKVVVGPTAQPRIFMRQLGETLGITGKDNEEVLRNTRSAIQGMAKLQIDMSKQAQNQGAISDYERKLFERASAGGDLTPVEITQLMVGMKKVAEYQLSVHQSNVDKVRGLPRGGDVLAPFLEIPKGAPGTAPSNGSPAKVTNEAEYNAIPSGTVYIAPDGKTRTKK